MAKSKDRPQTTATAVMSFPQPPLRKAEEYLKAYSGYAFTAISAIAQEVGSVQLKLFKKKFVSGKPEAQVVYEHEMLSLLHYVNPLTTFYDQVEATQIYLELTGEAFWVILRERGTPREMWLVRPDWMRIVPDKEEIIKHYEYHPGGSYNEKVVIPRENVIHFKYFNPLIPYRGKGSIQAAALPLDIQNFAQEYNRNFFFNSAVPGLVFTTEKRLNKKVIERFINQWQASYGGKAKSNKIAFLGSGLKMDKATMGAKELDFANQQKMMRDDILAVFKVPKTILGMTDQVNYANANATTRAFMERVITPRMRKFVGILNEFLVPMYSGGDSLFLDFVDPAPEDVQMKLRKYASARKYTWMTPNEIRQEENLEPVEGGDDLFAPLAGGRAGGSGEEEEEGEGDDTGEGLEESKGLRSLFKSKRKKKQVKKVKKIKHKKKPFKHMMPIPPRKIKEIRREKLEKGLTKDLTKLIGEMLKTKDNGTLGKVGVDKKKPIKKDEVFTEEAKDAYWRSFINMVTEREDELKEKVIELFREQEKLVLENLNNDVRYWRKDVRKGKEGSVIPSVNDLSIIWHSVFIQLIREIIKEQGDYTLDFLGAGGNLELTTDPAVEYLREHGAELIMEINGTTRDKLKEVLAEGFEIGESISELSERVSNVFKDATRHRAETIARTETLRASNFGTVEAYRQSGVVKAQEWLTERDDRACEFCLEMDGKIIGLDEKYFDKGDKLTVNGNDLKFDLLSVEYPPLHPNCRCTTMPVLV